MRDVEKSSRDPEKKQRYSPPDSSNEDLTALPYSKRLEVSPHLRPVTGEHGPYNFRSNSHSSLARERGKLQRPESLRNKRTAQGPALNRRKSNKKRKNDHVREEEIRAMSMPLPQMRPSGYYGHYTDMLRRESRKAKGGLHRRSDRPSSTISLPLEESIHSSMSSGSESREYRVSALDMFSPRPKIRFSVGSQYYYAGTGHSPVQPTRNSSKKERKMTFNFDDEDKENEKEYRKRSKRIDDLADDLDAGALREILERDKRRRERKRKADEEKLRRKLERRAEKQRAAERPGTPPVAAPESTGVVGLGLEKEVLTPMEDVQHSNPTQPDQIDTTVSAPQEQETPALTTPLESPTEEPVVADAQAVRYSRASLSSATPGHARASSNVSHMPELPSEIAARQVNDEGGVQEDPRASGTLHAVESVETTETISQKDGGRRRSSEGRRMRMWAAIFRRGRRTSTEKVGDSPSEVSFSNTSRESMSRQPLPAHLVATPPVFVRRASAVPARTRSKFREDLPEYPMSPPDSRIQSPEAEATTAIAARRGSRPLSNIRVESESPTSGDGSTADNETRPSLRTDSPVSPGVPPTGLMSQSLASIDSEGSWLSGKPIQRRSNKSHVRSSVGSTPTPTRQLEDFNASYEELGIPDDEYFRKLTPHVEDRRSGHSGEVFTRKASSTAIAAMSTTPVSEGRQTPPLDDHVPAGEEAVDENGDKLVQDSVERHPTIVHRQPRVKSTEALVSYFTAGEEPASSEVGAGDFDEEPTTPTSEHEPVTLQRAMSVDFGSKHVRHLSAGSAKLLEIPAKRSSVDQRRSSSVSPLQTAISQ